MKQECIYCHELTDFYICQKCSKYLLTKDDSRNIRNSLIDKKETKSLDEQSLELEQLIQD